MAVFLFDFCNWDWLVDVKHFYNYGMLILPFIHIDLQAIVFKTLCNRTLNRVQLYYKQSTDMLNLLLKSKIRADLLKLFFSNPENEFYIRELSRIIGTSAGNIQKELKKLENEQILKYKKRGNLKYYFLNLEYLWKIELQKIIAQSIGIEAELKTSLLNLKGIKFAFIFGSYAKGDFKADSDIDLFIIGNINEDDLITSIKKVEKNIGREINFHIAKPKDFLHKLKEKFFYNEILKKYILLTNNKDEFEKFIKQT
jgi:predicted nucleotidyltransferase